MKEKPTYEDLAKLVKISLRTLQQIADEIQPPPALPTWPQLMAVHTLARMRIIMQRKRRKATK